MERMFNYGCPSLLHYDDKIRIADVNNAIIALEKVLFSSILILTRRTDNVKAPNLTIFFNVLQKLKEPTRDQSSIARPISNINHY